MLSRVRLLLTISIGLLVLAACGEPVPPQEGFTLSVTVVGDGVVTSAPAGIDTAADKNSANFAENAAVTLTAAPTGAATFVGWSGACDGSAELTCEVEMTADTAVTATFTEDVEPGEDVTFTVTVVNSGAAVGTVSSDGVDCTDVCDITAPENSQVVLTATASPGGFAGWVGGDCDGSFNPVCTITVNADEADVTANFGDVVTETVTAAIAQAVEQLINTSSANAGNFPAGHNYTDSSDLDFGYDISHSTQQWIGLRFDFAAALPAGVTIQSAVIDMTAHTASSNTVNLTLSGEAVAAPAPFVDDPNGTGSADASTRAAANSTTATVDWSITDAWTGGDTVSTPDLAAVVQELVEVDGFLGSLVIFASPDADPSSTATRPVTNDDSIEMTVTYVVPPAPAGL